MDLCRWRLSLVISRASLYCRKEPRGSRRDCTYDQQIVLGDRYRRCRDGRSGREDWR